MKRHFLKCILAGSFWLGVNLLRAAPGTYTVGKGETLFGIARKLGLGVAQLYEINPGLKENPGLKMGQVILIPDSGAESVPAKPAQASAVVQEDAAYPQAEEFRTYTVQPKETAFGIARQFGISFEVLKKYNPELAAGLKAGMKLRIPISAPSPSEPKPAAAELKPVPVSRPLAPIEPKAESRPEPPAAKTVAESKPVAATNKALPVQAAVAKMPEPDLSKFSGRELDYKNQFMSELEGGKKLSKEKGSAIFLEEEENGNPYLALCDMVPVGSIVQIRNLLNGRTAFVKVLGKLPKEDKMQEVSIKIPSGLRAVLKTSDSRILVELSVLK
jgi:LysM repeat protein